MTITTLIIIPIVLYSIILHEISHGAVAYLLGDDTAKRARRLSLNPLDHIDKFGTIILPLALLILSGGKFSFGYAKPVPINPYNFDDYKKGTGLSALAGPMTNLIIAIFLSLIVRLIIFINPVPNTFLLKLFEILIGGASVNLFLMAFNLIPIPPLDGSKILGMFLSDEAFFKYTAKEKLGMQIFFGILMFNYIFHLNLFGFLQPIVIFLLKILTGLNL